jgi:hypothetical protein
MMADAHHFFYHTACFNDPTMPDEVFNRICFSDCYIYGKSTGNTRIEGLWCLMIGRTTEQWILFFSALEADGWFREDLASGQVILVFISLASNRTSNVGEEPFTALGSADFDSMRLAIRGYLDIQYVVSVPYYSLLF